MLGNFASSSPLDIEASFRLSVSQLEIEIDTFLTASDHCVAGNFNGMHIELKMHAKAISTSPDADWREQYRRTSCRRKASKAHVEIYISTFPKLKNSALSTSRSVLEKINRRR